MTELSAAATPSIKFRKAGGLDPWSPALLRLAAALGEGKLRITTPDGRTHRITGRRDARLPADLAGELVLNDPAAARRLILGGAVGFAEAYMDGLWRSPDLPGLLELVARNEADLRWTGWGGALAHLCNRLIHRLRDNSRRGSRRNIAFHYDLGNDFYRRWLDEGMQYSSALFSDPDQSLEDAQGAKLRRIAQLLEIEPGHDVLEIGCGWGALAEHLARDHDARVVGITLSSEQRAWAAARLARKCASGRVEIRVQDYRDVVGEFDRIASIEMIEAVGQERWPRYFATLRDRLKTGGVAVIQAITIADDRFDEYRRGCDFIQRHVFPGGMMPSPTAIRRHAAAAGLVVDHVERFGASYATTLEHWRRRFLAEWPTPDDGPFSARFHRMWDFYLSYCTAGFRAGGIDVGFWRFRRP